MGAAPMLVTLCISSARQHERLLAPLDESVAVALCSSRCVPTYELRLHRITSRGTKASGSESRSLGSRDMSSSFRVL